MTPKKVSSERDLVEVQWNGALSSALLQAGSLYMESDEQQATTDTAALADKAAVVPEVVKELPEELTEKELPEELTEEEASDRHRLELRVERAFYEAGSALRELRNRRLYRSTHKTFEEYCRDRFGFQRAYPYRLIDAAVVVDNLSPIGDILPTAESQCRPLARLEPDSQRQAWNKAVEAAGGNVPSGRIVKGIVERLKERHNTPPLIPYSEGDVVEIRAGVNSTLRKYDGCWGIITHVGTWNCTVHISVRDVNVQCKVDEMDKVDKRYTAEIRAVSERIVALMQRDDLSRTAIAVLETLVRQTCFSPDDLWFLEKVEERYGL